MEEENYKFRLSAFQKPLEEWLRSNPEGLSFRNEARKSCPLTCPAAVQPSSRYAEVMSFLSSAPLTDLSVSRPSSRLKWGIPVPDDSDQTIYVWIDALINYLTVTGYPWEHNPSGPSPWPADIHVVGKDILRYVYPIQHSPSRLLTDKFNRFHTVYWPAMLLAADLPLPKTVLAHAHWTMGKSKMSKSRGNVANPFEAIQKWGVDGIRFYLMRNGGGLGEDAGESRILPCFRIYSHLYRRCRCRLLGRAHWCNVYQGPRWPGWEPFAANDHREAFRAPVVTLYRPPSFTVSTVPYDTLAAASRFGITSSSCSLPSLILSSQRLSSLSCQNSK
jgi:hypothetical protein